MRYRCRGVGGLGQANDERTWYASRCSKLPTAGQGTFSQLATRRSAVLTRASYQRTRGRCSGCFPPAASESACALHHECQLPTVPTYPDETHVQMHPQKQTYCTFCKEGSQYAFLVWHVRLANKLLARADWSIVRKATHAYFKK